MDHLTALRRSLRMEGSEPRTVDWPSVSDSWGVRFPADYVAFIDTIGPGSLLEDLVVVHRPVVNLGNDFASPMGIETASARILWQQFRRSGFGRFQGIPVGLEPRLLSWGMGADGDMFCWDTSSSDPEAWPTVAFHRGDAVWSYYPFSMTEFLHRATTNDVPHWDDPGEVLGDGPVTYTVELA